MRKILSFIILFVLTIAAFADSASRKPFTVKQSDGTMLSVALVGDEALHYFVTLDGKYLVKEKTGDFYYATFSDEGIFVSMGVLAHNKDERSDAENALLSEIDNEAIEKAVILTHESRSAKYRTAVQTRSSSSTRAITTGEVSVPVLLVEFQDVKFSFKKEDIEKLLNEPNYKYKFELGAVESYGSARDYFIAQSGGLFAPNFVVTDVLTLPQNMAYYGGNTASGNDKNPQAMIRSGIELADAAGVDFSQFDNDKDGKVEFMYCIYAGYSEASGANENTVWPHQWTLTSNGSGKTVDGVYCNAYACSSELNVTEAYAHYGKWLAGIGAICHEFSHCLGLHDVYDVSYKSGVWGMDEWDVMAVGDKAAYGYAPVGYNSYQKEICGWKKLETLKKKGRYSMLPQTQGGVGYKIVNDANPNEFFILENRKREGWDMQLAADGMMIIHVDYDKSAWDNNKINTTSGHPRFQIVPADNELIAYSKANEEKFYKSLAGDLWPGKNNNNEFTDTSLPAANVYTGGGLNKPVTNIKYENYVASFNFMGGEIATPVAMPATDVTDNSFVANWHAVEYASKYSVELYRLDATENNDGEMAQLVNEDFLKCNKSNTAIQDDLDTYMQAPGWEGNNVYSENGMLCIGSLNNPGTIITPKFNTKGDVTITLKANKYNSNATSIKLLMEIVNASGEVLSSKTISSAGTFGLNAVVDGEFFVRFSTDAESANKRVLVDDISVVVTLPYKRVLLKEIVSIDNIYMFNDLEQGDYEYRVKASDGDAESEYSDYIKVTLGTTSVLDVVAFDKKIVVYSITGIKLYEGDADMLSSLPAGVYVVKSNLGVKKIKIE